MPLIRHYLHPLIPPDSPASGTRSLSWCLLSFPLSRPRVEGHRHAIWVESHRHAIRAEGHKHAIPATTVFSAKKSLAPCSSLSLTRPLALSGAPCHLDQSYSSLSLCSHSPSSSGPHGGPHRQVAPADSAPAGNKSLPSSSSHSFTHPP